MVVDTIGLKIWILNRRHRPVRTIPDKQERVPAYTFQAIERYLNNPGVLQILPKETISCKMANSFEIDVATFHRVLILIWIEQL